MTSRDPASDGGGLREIVIISGLSGSGKSAATRCFEDAITRISNIYGKDADARKALLGNGRIDDATRAEFLRKCGLAQASALVVTLDAPQVCERVVELARKLRPDLVIVARARDALGAYQGIVAFARRGIVKDKAPALRGFTRAFHAGVQWLAAPANREKALALLMAKMSGMQRPAAERAGRAAPERPADRPGPAPIGPTGTRPTS